MASGLELRCLRLDPRAVLPTQAYERAAAYDLYCLESVLAVGVTEIRTGLAIQVPKDHVGLILTKSGLAKRGIQVLGGVIDEDYRGEWFVILQTKLAHIFKPRDKIAQFVIVPLWKGNLLEVMELDSTERGTKGFGSSG